MKNNLYPYFFVAALCALSPVVVADNCVAIAGQHLEPSAIYDQRHQCGTCTGQAAHPALCRAINHVMVPYWSASADIVAIPHRGLWGQPIDNGPAENTLAAFETALNAGYRIIEVDAALTGPDSSGKSTVFLGHYFTMAAVGGPSTKTPHDYTPQDIVQFKMRKRDQSLSIDPKDRLMLLSEALVWAAQNQVLLLVDPKVSANPEPEEYEKIAAYSLNEAKKTGTLANIGLKVTDTYANTTAGIKPFLDAPYSAYEGQFLWSPIPNKYLKTTQEETLASIDGWHAGTNNSKQVITYEVSLYSPGYWGANAFTAANANYLNLFDYVKHLTPLGKRSALWSIDPMGSKGLTDKSYTWKFIGNTADDQRGNPIRNLSYTLARHIAINTDRPEWYEGLVERPY